MFEKMKKVSVVYLICGFLGAGKTTYSRKLAEKSRMIHLNPDEVCMQRYSQEEYENNWDFCFAQTFEFLWSEIADYIRQGQDVIFDVGFWTKSSREEAVKKVKQMGGNPIVHYVYAPDYVLKQRLMIRTGKIAEHNLKYFDDIKKSFEAPTADESCVVIENY